MVTDNDNDNEKNDNKNDNDNDKNDNENNDNDNDNDNDNGSKNEKKRRLQQIDRQTDIIGRPVFSDSGDLKTWRFHRIRESEFLHKTNTFSDENFNILILYVFKLINFMY